MLFQNPFLQALLFLFFSDKCPHVDWDVKMSLGSLIIIEFCVDPFYIYFNIIHIPHKPNK